MTTYVCGLVFTYNLDHIMLIMKQHPAHLEGFWNGVGGKVEEYDKSIWHAMSRECFEESTIKIRPEQWGVIAEAEVTVNGEQSTVHFLTTTYEELRAHARTIEEEVVQVHSVNEVINFSNLFPNLRWIIPLAQYQLQTYYDKSVEVNGTLPIKFKETHQIWVPETPPSIPASDDDIPF